MSNNSMSNASTSDESSFASLSRTLAETNQSKEDPTPPPPPSNSESQDQGDNGSND
jgi:hypothetical protein